METRHRTVVQIEVDAKDVKDAGTEISRAFDPKMIEGFESAIDRMTRSLTLLTKQISRVAFENKKLPGGGAQGGARERTGPAPRFAQPEQQQSSSFWPTAMGSFAGTSAAAWLSRASGSLGQASMPSGFGAALAGMAPGIGPVAQTAMGGLEQFHSRYSAIQSAIAHNFGATGRSDAMAGTGAAFGLTPEESSGELAQLASQSGLRGKELGSIYARQLELSRILGVRGAGAVVGAEGAGGGTSRDPNRLMQESVSTGIGVGIQKARLDRHLQTIAGWVEQVRTNGIDFSADTANDLVRGFATMNFRGENASRMAQNVGEGLSRIASGTGGGIGTGLALQAAQEVLGDEASIADMRVALESRNKFVIRRFVELVQQITGGNREAMFGILQASGLGLTQTDVDKLAKGDASMLTDLIGTDQAKSAIGRDRGGFAAAAGQSIFEAHEGMQQYAVGRKNATRMNQLHGAELQLASEIAPWTMNAVEMGMGAVRNAATAAKKAKDAVDKAIEEVLGPRGFNGVIDGAYDPNGTVLRDGVGPLLDETATNVMNAWSMGGMRYLLGGSKKDGPFRYNTRTPEGLTITEGESLRLGDMTTVYDKPKPPPKVETAAPDKIGPQSSLTPGGSLRDAAAALMHAADQIDKAGRAAETDLATAIG